MARARRPPFRLALEPMTVALLLVAIGAVLLWAGFTGKGPGELIGLVIRGEPQPRIEGT